MNVDTHLADYLLDAPADPAALEEIPVLDVGPCFAGEAGALDRLAGELRAAQEEIGFLAIVNHGVPRALIDGAYDQLRRFFALPLEAKLALKMGRSGLGYAPIRSTVYKSSPVAENTRKDLNETVLYARERAPDHPVIAAGLRFHGPNQWPADLPGFRDGMLAYYAAMEALGYRLLPVYARALDKPADFFDPYFTDPMWSTRNSYYPAIDAEDGQFGIAPHRDHGFFTMLPVSTEPGLQILARTGRWLAVEIPEGAMLVNTGEFMNRLTNGRFLATPHRVMPPRRARYSLGFSSIRTTTSPARRSIPASVPTTRRASTTPFRCTTISPGTSTRISCARAAASRKTAPPRSEPGGPHDVARGRRDDRRQLRRRLSAGWRDRPRRARGNPAR